MKEGTIIPSKYSYIEDMPALRGMDKTRRGFKYIVIMVGVACETNPYLTMSEIYRIAKEMGYLEGMNFSTIYNSIKVFLESHGCNNAGPKEFIAQLAWDALHTETV